MARQKWSWTPLQLERAERVQEVVDDLTPYWPLTLRQIYYRLVAQGHIKNTKSQYNMLSKLVKWMRIDDKMPWGVLEDRTRRVTDKKGWESLRDFIDYDLDQFLVGYARCLVQKQGKYVEVWVEKDALSSIFEEVVYPYCMRAVVCRGYQSVTFLADFKSRAERAIMKGQDPVVLYFGDLDPSGIQMLEATIETLEEELDLYGVEFKRVALNADQVTAYNLPQDPTAAKSTDSRYLKYHEVYGDLAVELDALHPRDLQGMIKEAIEKEVDMKSYLGEQREEFMDREILKQIRRDVIDVVRRKVKQHSY